MIICPGFPGGLSSRFGFISKNSHRTGFYGLARPESRGGYTSSASLCDRHFPLAGEVMKKEDEMEHIDAKKVPKGVCKVMAYAVLHDMKKAFENPAIQEEYQKWLEDYRRKKLAAG